MIAAYIKVDRVTRAPANDSQIIIIGKIQQP